MGLQIAITVILVLTAAVFFYMYSKKKKWFVVYTAQPEKLLLSKSPLEWESKGLLVFRKEDNTKIFIHAHWILKIEEVKPSELDTVRKQIEAEYNAK